MAINGSIHVYPAREMLALDMAEVIAATYTGKDGIIQGCTISVVDGKLHMTKGRMIIMGRLCVVDSDGDFDLPDDISGKTDTQHRYVMAVCDLTASEPFYVKIFSASEYYAVEEADARDSADNYINFNVNNGVHMFKLGTVDIDPATGTVTGWKPFASASIKNNSTQGATVNNELTNIRTLVTNVKTEITNAYKAADNVINNSINYLKAYCGYNLKRAWASSKFELKWKEQTGIRILPGMTLYVYFRKEYDSVDMNYYIPFGASSDEITNYRNQARSRYNEAVANNPSKAVLMYECNQGGPASKIAYQSAATNPPSYTPTYDQYGVRSTVDTRKVAAAVSGVDLSGGTGTKYVVLTTFGMNGTNLFVGLHNVSTGSDIVIVNVRILVLYVQNE